MICERGQSPPHDPGEGRMREDDLGGEAETDCRDQGDDECLETPESLLLQRQDQQHVQRREYHAPDQRNTEQQLQRDCGADDLRQVAGGDGDFAEHPERERHAARVVIAACLCQVASGDDAQLERQRLQKDRHQVRQQDHAEQHVAEAGAAGEVGGPVPRIHVTDGHHVTRSGECQQLAPPGTAVRDVDAAKRLGKRRPETRCAPAMVRNDRCVRIQRAIDRGSGSRIHQVCLAQSNCSARSRPTTRRTPSSDKVTGPLNGC